MTLRKPPVSLICIAGALLTQACVQYTPQEGSPPPPPQPPHYPAQYGESQAVQQDSADHHPDDALLAPIALYPDPLIALILPASTFPSEISAASAYMVQYGDMTRVDSQPWDPSVRALAHYPPVIEWMAQNMAWTQALGYAFLSSPGDVMDSVQRLRARAEAAGRLTSTPQQQVVDDDGEIEIVPAQPDLVYIPAYDPGVVYSDESYYGYGGPFINFGEPYPAGLWLSYSFDWRRHRVWAGKGDSWRDHGSWRPPHFDGNHAPPGARPWQPRPGGPGGIKPGRGSNTLGPRPVPMQGAPNHPPPHDRKQAPKQGRARPPSSQVQPAPRTAAPPVERPRLGAPAAPDGGNRPAAPGPKSPPPQNSTAGNHSEPAPGTARRPGPAPARPEPSREGSTGQDRSHLPQPSARPALPPPARPPQAPAPAAQAAAPTPDPRNR